VFFEYGLPGQLINSVSAGTLSNVGVFSAPISGLTQYTWYSFRACATTMGTVVCDLPGVFRTEATVMTPTQSLTPLPPTPTPTAAPVVRTDPATSVTSAGATLNGAVTDMLGETSAAVYFKYQLVGTGNPVFYEDAGTLSSTGTFSASISALAYNAWHTFQACATTVPTGYDVCGSSQVFRPQ